MPRVNGVETNGSAKPPGSIDQAKITAGVRMILEGLGEDPDREGLRDTADRVARMYAEVFQGLYQDPRDYLTAVFDEDHDEMVVVKDIPFYSMCEHHLLPFQGLGVEQNRPRGGSICPASASARALDIAGCRPAHDRAQCPRGGGGDRGHPLVYDDAGCEKAGCVDDYLSHARPFQNPSSDAQRVHVTNSLEPVV